MPNMPHERPREDTLNLNLNLGLSEGLQALISRALNNHALLTEIGHKLDRLEQHMAKQDDQIADFQAAANEKLAALGVSLDNIAADEQVIIGQLQNLPTGELSVANQAILNKVISDLTVVAGKSQAIADSLPDVPTA